MWEWASMKGSSGGTGRASLMIDPGAGSGDRLVDDLSLREHRHRASLAVGQQSMVVDAEQVVDRGQDVLGRDAALNRVARDPVRSADHPSTRDPAAGEDHRVAARPVVA